MRRTTRLLALLLLTVTSCGTDGGGGSADDVKILQEAATRTLASTVQIEGTITAGPSANRITGAADFATGVVAIEIAGGATPFEAIAVGDAVYLKQEGAAKPWLRLEMSKLSPSGMVRQNLDITAPIGIVGGAISVEQDGPGRYRGVADLDKAIAADTESTNLWLRDTAAVATNASALAFDASIDDDGRLAWLAFVLETPGGPGNVDMTFGGFGEPVNVVAPPDDDIEVATEDMYAFL